MATIEVKSWLRKTELFEAEESARTLYRNVYDSESGDDVPLCAVVGFYGNGARKLSKEETGRSWLNENKEIFSLCAICLVNKYSWVRTGDWNFQAHEKETYEETKRFIALVLDTIRTRSHKRFMKLSTHENWLGYYIRDRNIL